MTTHKRTDRRTDRQAWRRQLFLAVFRKRLKMRNYRQCTRTLWLFKTKTCIAINSILVTHWRFVVWDLRFCRSYSWKFVSSGIGSVLIDKIYVVFGEDSHFQIQCFKSGLMNPFWITRTVESGSGISSPIITASYSRTIIFLWDKETDFQISKYCL
jgi:hypothetical protein